MRSGPSGSLLERALLTRYLSFGRGGARYEAPAGNALYAQFQQLLSNRSQIAAARGHAMVGTEHLLLAMTCQTDDSFARRLLDEAGVTEMLRSRVESVLGDD